MKKKLVSFLNTHGLPSTYKGTIFLEACNSGTYTEQMNSSFAERFFKEINKKRKHNIIKVFGYDGKVSFLKGSGHYCPLKMDKVKN